MNGAMETRGIILQNIDSRIRQIETDGCPMGAVQEEKIHNMVICMEEVKKSLGQINDKLFWWIIIMIVMTFMAGVNTWESILKLFVH